MTHSSKIAGNLIKKLSDDPKEQKLSCKVTENQVATQILLNGKTKKQQKDPKITRNINRETSHLGTPFTIKELQDDMDMLKNGKAAGVDDICTEQIKYLGQRDKS